jgi:DNA (cytosine-5)-methyltransferase 1
MNMMNKLCDCETQPLCAIDLFSGAGGMTLGLHKAGFNVIGAVEIDPLAVETYRHNHPDVQIWHQDIQHLPPKRVRKELGLRRGQLDLLAGCPPCQGFSAVRTLNGSKTVIDNRNDLVFDFLEYAKELRPKVVIMENVPGLLEDSRMQSLKKELIDLSYHVGVEVLDAAVYGVPQRRRRLILLASRIGSIKPMRGTHVTKTVRQTIGHLPEPGESGDPCHDVLEKRSTAVLSMISQIPPNGGSRKDLDCAHQLRCHQRCDGFSDVYGRMKWDSVAPTITSGCTNPSKGRFLHPDQHRAITPREAALLQSFPLNYFFSMRRGKEFAARMIGNALPPEFIRRHAVVIRKHIELHLAKSEK